MRPFEPYPYDSKPRNYDKSPWSYCVIDDVFVELANAIVKQAAADYMAALRLMVKRDPLDNSYISALKKKQDAEAFFNSLWFAELTTYDPKTLVIQLRATVKVDLMEREREQRRRSA